MDFHRPEHCRIIGTEATGRGTRYYFRVPSSSAPHDSVASHSFAVDGDGTRPHCDCTAFQVRKSCTLSQNGADVMRHYWRRYYAAKDWDPKEYGDEDSRLRATWTDSTVDRLRYAGLGDAIALSFGTLEEHDPWKYGPTGPPREVREARKRVRRAGSQNGREDG